MPATPIGELASISTLAQNAYSCPKFVACSTELVNSRIAVSDERWATLVARASRAPVPEALFWERAIPVEATKPGGGSPNRSLPNRCYRGASGTAARLAAPAGCAGEIQPGTRDCIAARIAASNRAASAGVISIGPRASVR